MPRLTEEQQFAIAIVPAMIIAAPVTLANRAGARIKKTAQNHPVATSLAVGSVGGVGLAVALINGDQVHPNSLYARLLQH